MKAKLSSRAFSDCIVGFGAQFFRDSELKSLRHLVFGQRVALVGPSITLAGMGLGAEIDNCDVVVKFNRMATMPQSMERDYGRRMDILVHGLLEGDSPGYCGPVEPKNWRKRWPRYLLFYPFRLGLESYQNIGAFIRRGGERPTIVDAKLYRSLVGVVGARLSSGVVALQTCLSVGAAGIEVFGMDGFSTGHAPSFGANQELPIEKFGHSRLGELRFWQIVEADDRVRVVQSRTG